MDTQDIVVWYLVLLTGVGIVMTWAVLRASARASAIDDSLRRLIGSLDLVGAHVRPLAVTSADSLEPSAENLPATAVLEIRETYEETVRMQRQLYEVRISDLTAIYDEQVQYLRSELSRAGADDEKGSELAAMHEQHLELMRLVKELIVRLDV